MIDSDARALLAGLFDAAVAAADPYDAIRAHLPEKPKGRTVVVGAGKAAGQMAAAFEALWDAPLEGVVVDRYGPVPRTERIRVLQAAHPNPDQAGIAAARSLLAAVDGLSADDLVVALISGGGSSLLPCPAGELSFEDELAVNAALLHSGAPIAAMNVVRKHLSAIKGGRLARAAAPARVVSFIISDVAGDDPAMVASGPTVPGKETVEDALAIVDEFKLALPERVALHLRSRAAAAPSPDDPAFRRNAVHVIASAGVSLDAAAVSARTLGIEPMILSDAIEGEARDIGRMHAAIARETALRNRPFQKPVVILSGGETTVTIGNGSAGKGGRNTELLLALAHDIEGVAGIDVLAADTDGIDGSEDNAGAFADGKSLSRMRAAGVDPKAALIGHDAWSAFHASGDLFVPGPTGTNVNDFRAMLVR
ncbi:glycerate kinase type-2 family protein [Pelagibacterium lacus]|uniref:Glycerate kinase n=1 Tax=Pelagibacterium lacus TaxID=2282655 RepID=A0A369W9Z2_9HYPH|nr:glycerate kinase [Pelagibacterium lacus]RDE10092.1 glycerate kinase [Pelagibacterium lacus]